MKRRDFLKVTGIGAAGAATLGRARHRAVDAGNQMANDGELAEIARHALRRRRVMGKAIAEATDNNSRSRPSPAAKSFPACRCSMPYRTAPSRWDIRRPTITSARTRPSRSAPRCRSDPNARLNQAWFILGGGQELLNEFYKGYNVTSLLAGNTGCQMGGWFRKEIKTVDDLKGLKIPHRRLRRPRDAETRRGAAADSRAATSIRRWRRAPSTPPSGSAPMTTRSSASTRSRRTITIRAGGKAARCCSASSISTNGIRCPNIIRASSSRRAIRQ